MPDALALLDRWSPTITSLRAVRWKTVTGVAQRMISSVARLRALLLEQLPLVGVVEEGLHAVGDRVAGGLVAGNGQHDHEVAELVLGERLPVDVALHQLGDQVVPRVDLPVGRHLHRVAEDLGGGDVGLAAVLRVVAGEHLVGPVEELAAVLERYAEQVGDRLQRQLGRHVLDEVALTLGQGVVDDLVGPSDQHVVQRADRAGREAAADQLAGLGVHRRVLVDQHDLLQLDLVARHVRAEPDDRAVLLAGEVLAVLGDRGDVGVLAHRPVAVVVEAGTRPRVLLTHHTGAVLRSSMNCSSGIDPSHSSGSVGSNPVGTAGVAVTARTSTKSETRSSAES